MTFVPWAVSIFLYSSTYFVISYRSTNYAFCLHNTHLCNFFIRYICFRYATRDIIRILTNYLFFFTDLSEQRIFFLFFLLATLKKRRRKKQDREYVNHVLSNAQFNRCVDTYRNA
jgi:hypothetical protein